MTGFRSIILTVISRGLRKRCPQCGSAGLFERWYTLAPACPQCQLDLRSSEGDTWAFMYLSTAALTGLFVVAMFLFRPTNTASGRLVVLFAALFVILGSLPWRKSLALGFDYLIAHRWDNNNETKRFRLHPDDDHIKRHERFTIYRGYSFCFPSRRLGPAWYWVEP